MKEDIIIVGIFDEMIELCEDCGFNIIGFVDNSYKEKNYHNYQILGTDNQAADIFKEYSQCKIVITPDSPHVRKKLTDLYKGIGFKFAKVISPDARISRSAQIGEGTVIQSGVNISAGTVIGANVKVNTNANIMHDNAIGDFTTIAPNAVSLGYVRIGNSSYIGANSTILPRIQIGNGVTVGAGAVVTKDVNDGLVVKGVPAK